MAKPTPRADLVSAVSKAVGIVCEAIPLPEGNPALAGDRKQLRAAALPVIIRELLDTEVAWDSPPTR